MSDKKFQVFSVLADSHLGQYAIPHAAMEIKSIADAFVSEDGNSIDWSTLDKKDLLVLDAAQDDMDEAKNIASKYYDYPDEALSEIIGDVLNIEVTLNGVSFSVTTGEGAGDVLLVSEALTKCAAECFLCEHKGFYICEYEESM